MEVIHTDQDAADSEKPEQALWRAVVARMLEDAGLAPTNADNSRWRLDAQRWFKSRDFHTVCDLADVAPGAVLAMVPA